MATEVGGLFYDLDIPTDKLQASLSAADKQVADTGAKVESNSQKMQDGLNNVAKVAAVAGAGLTLISKNATDFTTDFVKSSTTLGRQIGVSTEEASKLTAALGRMGISAESASATFGIFSKNIVKATADSQGSTLAAEKLKLQIEQTQSAITKVTAEITRSGDKTGELGLKLRELNNTLATQKQGLNDTANAFQKLGVYTTDASGKQKDFTTILFEVADKFKAMPDGIDKTATSMELFGRSGKDMIKVLNLGSDGIKDLEKQADALGLTLNANTIGKINDLIQSQKELKQQTDAVKIAIGTATAPVLTSFNKHLNDLVQNLLQAPAPIKDATVAFLAFGGPVFGGVSAVAGLTANLVSAWPALVAFRDATIAATVAQGGLDAALAANPIGLLIVVILAGVAAWVYLLTHMQQVASFLQTDWGIAILAFLALMAPFIGVPLLIITQWEQVKAYWHGLQDFFSGAAAALGDTFRGIASAIAAPFRAAFNAIAGAYNSTIGKISFHAPSWVPGLGGKGWDVPDIPMLAQGGIATGPTPAVFGEAGAEAVLPLSYLNRYSTLFDRIENMARGSGEKNFRGGDTTITIGTIQDRADADYLISHIDRTQQLESLGGSPPRVAPA